MYLSPILVGKTFLRLLEVKATPKAGVEATSSLFRFLAFDALCKIQDKNILLFDPNLNIGRRNRKALVDQYLKIACVFITNDRKEWLVDNLGTCNNDEKRTCRDKVSNDFLTAQVKQASISADTMPYPRRPASLLNLGVKKDGSKWGIEKHYDWQGNIDKFANDRKSECFWTDFAVFIARKHEFVGNEFWEELVNFLAGNFTKELSEFWKNKIYSEKKKFLDDTNISEWSSGDYIEELKKEKYSKRDNANSNFAFSCKNTNSNLTKQQNEVKMVLANQDIIPLDGSDTSSDELEISTPFDPNKIRVETKNTQMDALIKRLFNDEIDLSPNFQRSPGIWDDDVQSRLIESMLIKIPLPAFYLDASDDNNWLVVDGLQRLTTIKRFVIDEELSLVGLEFLQDLHGKNFSDLPRKFQRRIEETDIVLYLVQPGTPQEVKYDIFKRINTGGAPLNSQEIRHALNQGPVVDLLKELACSEEFKNATDYSVSSKRMVDRECVLRFLAFSIYSPETYQTSNFDKFLNDSMAKINRMTSNEHAMLKKKFLKSMEIATKLFGVDAFRKRYKTESPRFQINKALFETWSVNLAQVSEDQVNRLIARKEILKEKFMNLLQSASEFEESISQSTGSVKRVHARFHYIGDIIKETLK